MKCKYCSSYVVTRYGHDSRKRQRWLCKSCKKTFVRDGHAPGARYPAKIIRIAVSFMHSGMPTRRASAALLDTTGVRVHPSTLARWRKNG